MMNQIKRTTKTAKERLLQMFKEKQEIKNEFNSLTKELRLKQSQSDYDETDVDHWKAELTKLTKQLRQLLTSNDNKIDWNTNSSIDLANWIQAVPLPKPSPNQEQLFTGGALLHKGHQLQLNEFYGQTSQRWHLIYKAEKNGFAAKDFHRQCDGEGPTMTIIQSQEGNYLFGGTIQILSLPLNTTGLWDQTFLVPVPVPCSRKYFFKLALTVSKSPAAMWLVEQHACRY
ncbi:unnamed protein product [Didymodactylos carnosus]|nr:unnamed protein product [Didymodactylos carnosus]CAF4037092.1 unnamed protein product [Didymodactylos carnosus]